MNKYKCFIYSCSMFKLYLLAIHHNHTMILISSILITGSTSIIMLYSALQASAFLGLPSPIADNSNFLTYQDSTLGIKIDYPLGWIHELHPGNLVTFLASLESDSNTYPAGLGITVQHLGSGNTSLNEITKVQIKNLTQSHPDFKLTESTNSILAGNTAHKIVFSATDNMKHKRTAMQIWTLKGDNAYLITYKAEPGKYSKYLPTIQKMIDSFQIIN
jgi:eukaryotic-like serine/threonine-protein kinase